MAISRAALLFCKGQQAMSYSPVMEHMTCHLASHGYNRLQLLSHGPCGGELHTLHVHCSLGFPRWSTAADHGLGRLVWLVSMSLFVQVAAGSWKLEVRWTGRSATNPLYPRICTSTSNHWNQPSPRPQSPSSFPIRVAIPVHALPLVQGLPPLLVRQSSLTLTTTPPRLLASVAIVCPVGVLLLSLSSLVIFGGVPRSLGK